MTYDEIAAAYLSPSTELIPEPDVDATPARRLRDALEPIATQGWWPRPVGERLEALGLDFFAGYVWGRAAALGTPVAAVVAATFGVFEPAFIGAVYDAGAASSTRGDVLVARGDGAAASVGAVATDDECSAVADPLMAAVAGLDGLGRPLFSALRALPVPTSASGRMWRAAELVREHRGDGHLAILVDVGVTAIEANVLTERWLDFGLGEYSATRGFGADAIGNAVKGLGERGWMDGNDLTDAGRAARHDIEVRTDATQSALIVALGDRLDAVVDGAAAISSRLIDTGSFPSDPRKRAAG